MSRFDDYLGATEDEVIESLQEDVTALERELRTLRAAAIPGLRLVTNARADRGGLWFEFTAGGETVQVQIERLAEHCNAASRKVLRAWCAERRGGR